MIRSFTPFRCAVCQLITNNAERPQLIGPSQNRELPRLDRTAPRPTSTMQAAVALLVLVPLVGPKTIGA